MARDPFISEQLKTLRAAAKALPAAEKAAAEAHAKVAELTRAILDAVRDLAPLMDTDALARAARLTPDEIRDIAGQQAPPTPAGPAPLGERTLDGAGDITSLAGASVRPPDGRRYARWRTLFVHLGRGQVWDVTDRRAHVVPGPMSLPALLTAALHAKARRVYICDGPDWCVEPGDTSRASAVLRWIGQTVPGWRTPDGKSHYVRDPETPTGYYEHVETGAMVEVHRAGSWYGTAGEYNPRVAGVAFAMLDHVIGEQFRGQTVLSTPATTGRALWRSTIPQGREWPILSENLRRLIKATSGQGRAELLPALGGGELAEVRQYDGRLMYGALVAAMPAGPPTFYRDGAEVPDRVLMGAGRWRITARVPDGWDHVGLLPAPREGTRAAWRYPAEPGESFTTWCTGREVALARQHGWHVAIHEGFTFPTAKVLDTWADRLKRAAATLGQWAEAGEHPEACALAERAVRFLILHTIGVFASMSHPVLKTCPADRPEMAQAARPIDGIQREGDLLVWHERAPLDPWSEQTSHPEYSAEIWGRARVRLLQGPKDYPEMGALSLGRRHVIAFDTDALYLGVDPGWADDGKPGRLRLKATAAGPLPYPASMAELREIVK